MDKINKLKIELSDITDKIDNMIELGVDETNPKLDKLNTKQHDLEIELEFLTDVMGGK